MPLVLDAAFWRRVYAERQRAEDDRERAAGTGRRGPAGSGPVRAVPLSHEAAMKSARAELNTLARTIENLHEAVHS